MKTHLYKNPIHFHNIHIHNKLYKHKNKNINKMSYIQINTHIYLMEQKMLKIEKEIEHLKTSLIIIKKLKK